ITGEVIYRRSVRSRQAHTLHIEYRAERDAMCERVLFTMMMVHLTKLTMVPLFAYAATEGVRSGDRAGRDVSLRAGSGARRLDDDGSVCRNDIPGVGSSGGTGDICCVQECQQ
ncbi:unnamed protein product, partial [Pylaiella littoralis]